MNISAFSERLKDLRIDAGMTSDQLAKRIGVTKSTISKVFSVSSDYLLGLKDTI